MVGCGGCPNERSGKRDVKMPGTVFADLLPGVFPDFMINLQRIFGMILRVGLNLKAF
jgi:hypothetical protein